MTKRFLAVAASLFALSAVGAYRSDEHGFTVNFPAGKTPVKSAKDAETKGVKYTTHQYRVAVSDDLEYAVAVTPFPPELIASSKPQVLLKGGQDGSLRGMDAELVEEKELEVNGWPARRFSAKRADGSLHFRLLLALVDNLQYSVIVGFTKGHETEADAFVSSFQFNRKAPPPSDQSYLLETADFRLKFPRKPELSEAPTPTPAGEVIQHKYVAQAPSLATVFIWVDYPGKVDSKKALEGAKAGIGGGENKILSAKPIKSGRHPGYDLVIESKGQKLLARLYMVNNRLYQALAIAQPDRGEDENARAFVNSFELLTKGKGGLKKPK